MHSSAVSTFTKGWREWSHKQSNPRTRSPPLPYLSEYLNRHGYFSLNYTGLVSHLDFPGGTRDKKLTCQCRKCKGGGLIPRSEDPLEEELIAHSSVLTWNIPWTEKPGGIYPMGPQSQTWLSTQTECTGPHGITCNPFCMCRQNLF